MKFPSEDKRVHVMDNRVDVWNLVRDISEDAGQEEPFYVCDIGDIVNKHNQWREKMPRVQPYYAVKCNDSLTVIEVLAALGTGFDCASKGEINKVLALGVHPDRIILANPAKPASHIRHAASTQVKMMTFDNETELYKVKNFFPTAKLVIRIRCDAEVAQCPLGMKFGCDALTEAPGLLKTARCLGLQVIGVSFHVGSGCGDPPVFRRAISAAKDLFDYGIDLGYNFYLLDIGGGYPGNTGTSIDKIAEVVNTALDDYFPDPSIQIIAEPGRYYVASAYTLACNVHSKREVLDPITGSIKHTMYFINDGVYGSFNCLLYDHQHVTPIPLKEPLDDKLVACSLWGPTCDGLDQVAENILLPEMAVGDWVGFANMGAYTLPVASPFNGFPIPKVHVVANKQIWMMLKDLLPMTEDHFVHPTPGEVAIPRQPDVLTVPLESIPTDNVINIEIRI